MSKGLEAFERIQYNYVHVFKARENGKEQLVHDFITIKKELKAFEIMLEKEVNIRNFKNKLEAGWNYELFEEYCLDNCDWEDYPAYVYSMTKEQFELVKMMIIN